MLTLDQLISEATALPNAAKAIPIDKIMESMAAQIDRDILTKTVQKAQDRIAEIDRGEVQAIPGDMALARVRHIEKTPGVVGGDACIRGTRIPVWELVEYRQIGASNNKILEARSVESLKPASAGRLCVCGYSNRAELGGSSRLR